MFHLDAHEPLGLVGVPLLDGGEDGPVLLGGRRGPAAPDSGLPGLLNIIVEQRQNLLQRTAAAALIDDLVEPVVQVPHLQVVPPAHIEFLQLHDLPQVLQLLRSDVLRGPAGGQALDADADGINIVHVVPGDAHHHGALVVDGLHQALQLQLHQRLPDGGAGHTQLAAQLGLGKTGARDQVAAEDLLFQLVKHLGAHRRGSVDFIDLFHRPSLLFPKKPAGTAGWPGCF